MKKTLIAIIGAALLAGAAGCSKDSGGSSDCDAASSHMKDIITKKMGDLPPEMKDKMSAGIDKMVSAAINRCKTDGWSKDMLDCVNKSDGSSSCNDKLTKDQKDKLDADMMKAMQDMGGMPAMPK